MTLIRFSILLPVRNGGPYLKVCVQSILEQTYPHFELQVLDNASTDDTVPWLTSIKDSRLRLWRAPCALSIEESWARIKDVPKQEFMTTIGHDDLFDPHYLEVTKVLHRETSRCLFLSDWFPVHQRRGKDYPLLPAGSRA